MTPVMYAALNGHEEIVKELIKIKCDVNLTDNKGQNALHLAVVKEHCNRE